ncbi:MAG: efflux RND transporter periplasmic adaptor subunit [Flavisolibacter sp.]
MIKISKDFISKRFFIAIGLPLLIASCNNSSPVPVKSQETTPDSVIAFVLKQDSVKKDLSLPGELLPNENSQIRAKVQGYIRKVHVDIGSKVSKGQVLALIDAQEINSRVSEINAKVKAAAARFQTSKDYYERINTASKAEGVIAASELQRTRDQMLADEADYIAAKYSAESFRQMGRYLAIIAPYRGIITKKNIDPGSFVGNANEKPLFELQDNATLKLMVAVPEAYSGAVLLGNTGDLITRSFPDKKFIAKLVRKAGSIDNATRSELWEFKVPNSGGELKAGSYADVKLHFLRSQPSLTVPSSSIVTTLERKFVIKAFNNTAQWVDVRTGFNMGDKQEIFGDLHPGDTLVLKANDELKSSAKLVTKQAKLIK